MLRRTGRRAPSTVRRRVLAGAVVVLAVLLLLPDRLGLDRWLPFAVFSAVRPALVAAAALAMVAALVAAVVTLARRRRAPARSTLAAGLLVAVVVVAAAVPVAARAVPDAPPAGGREVTVLSFNVLEGQADPDALAAAITRAAPDLVVLPEAGERFRGLMAARLPAYRSWTNVPPQAEDVRGVVVLASPRAGDVRAERLADGTRYPWAVVTGGLLGATRLVGVHVVSPVPRWIGHWPGELASLRRWCSGAGPTLIVGDLNATPDHGPFRVGAAGCRDAATERGASLVGTWPTSVPRALGAQIDHVLSVGGPRARELSVLDLPGSDHRALLARMRLPEG